MTVSVTTPKYDAWLGGLSAAFSLGAPHRLARGALVQDASAVHCSLSHGDSAPSVSTKIGAMRRLLTQEVAGEIGAWFRKVAEVRSRALGRNAGSCVLSCRVAYWCARR